MDTGLKRQVGRVALRVEGAWWVAYYALADTMDGAEELARIRMTLVQDPERKAAFMALMRDSVSDIFRDEIGERPEWQAPKAAPEYERSGAA